MNIDLTGRVALVTGAAQGIGLEIATQLAAAGAVTVLSDVNPEVADRARALSDQGHDATSVILDTTDEASIQAAMAELESTVGAPSILINNAGISSPSPTIETTAESWNRVLAVNLTGPFLCARAVLPGMRKAGWGRIVNMSSFNAKSAPVNGDNASYAASKAGLTGLIHNLAVEFGPDQITVNGIAPGIVDTTLLRRVHPPERLEELKKRLPVGRFTTPADIASLAVFLSSDQAQSITGEIININGGLYFD
jgi:NAD(P)-dependent dehydrogenase (short-subunit alcohol dehydrogenase family)